MKKIIYAGLVIAVLIATGWFVIYGLDNTSDNNNKQTEQATEESSNTEASEDITFSDDGRTVTYSGQEGRDALSILKDLTENVETESSSIGEFVTSINGVTADPDTEFWAFYVNGKLANEGAGTYQTKNTDIIEWRIDKIEL